MRRLLAYAAIYFLFGGTFLAIRIVVLVTPPFSAAALRFFLSGMILLAISRLEKAPWPTAAEWKNSAKLGFVMFAIDYACLFWAEQRVYSGIAAIVAATIPVWVFLAEWLFAGTQQISRGMVIGSGLGIAGVALLMKHGGGSVGAASAPMPATNPVAILVLLIGSIAWASGTVWSRSLQLPAQQSARAALQMTIGGVLLGILALLAGEGRKLPAMMHQWTVVTCVALLYLILASILGFTAYVWLLHHEPAGRVASYAYVNPVIALMLGASIGDEHFGGWQIAGAGLVLLAVFAALTSRKQSMPKAA